MLSSTNQAFCPRCHCKSVVVGYNENGKFYAVCDDCGMRTRLVNTNDKARKEWILLSKSYYTLCELERTDLYDRKVMSFLDMVDYALKHEELCFSCLDYSNKQGYVRSVNGVLLWHRTIDVPNCPVFASIEYIDGPYWIITKPYSVEKPALSFTEMVKRTANKDCKEMYTYDNYPHYVQYHAGCPWVFNKKTGYALYALKMETQYINKRWFLYEI